MCFQRSQFIKFLGIPGTWGRNAQCCSQSIGIAFIPRISSCRPGWSGDAEKRAQSFAEARECSNYLFTCRIENPALKFKQLSSFKQRFDNMFLMAKIFDLDRMSCVAGIT